jgi:lysine-N-methylase
LNCGEDCLCEICREHPRFYNDTANGKEVGVGMACEEACRLILSSDGYGQIREIGSVDGEAEPLDFDVLPIRAHVFETLSDRTKSYEQRLAFLAEQFHVFIDDLSDDGWRELLESLEYLDSDHKKLFACYTSKLRTEETLTLPLERALAYFVYRHCTQALDLESFSAALGFAMFCERLIASVAASQGVQTVSELAELARIVSEELEYSEDNTEAIKAVFTDNGI